MSRLHEAHYKPVKKRKPKLDKKELNWKNNSKRLRTRIKRKEWGKLVIKNQKQSLLVKSCQKKRGAIWGTILIDDYV